MDRKELDALEKAFIDSQEQDEFMSLILMQRHLILDQSELIVLQQEELTEMRKLVETLGGSHGDV